MLCLSITRRVLVSPEFKSFDVSTNQTCLPYMLRINLVPSTPDFRRSISHEIPLKPPRYSTKTVPGTCTYKRRGKRLDLQCKTMETPGMVIIIPVFAVIAGG